MRIINTDPLFDEEHFIATISIIFHTAAYLMTNMMNNMSNEQNFVFDDESDAGSGDSPLHQW